MASTIGELLLKISADSAQLRSELGKAASEVKGFASRISENIEDIKGLLFFEAITDAVEKFGEFISETAKAAQELNNMSQVLGVSTADMTRWGYAARQAGMTQEELSLTFERLSRNMEYALTGEGKQTQAFKALGVEVLKSTGHLREAPPVLLDIADKFARMKDGAGKTALAVMMMGREGAQLIPMLNQGSEGIKQWMDESDRMARTLGTDAVASATKFNQELSKLRGGLEILGVAVINEIEPAFSEWLKSMDIGGKQVTGFHVVAEKLAMGLKLLAGMLLTAESGFERLTIRVIGSKAAWDALTKDGLAAARNELYKTYQALEDEAKRYDAAQNFLGWGKNGYQNRPINPDVEIDTKAVSDLRSQLKDLEDSKIKLTAQITNLDNVDAQIKSMTERLDDLQHRRRTEVMSRSELAATEASIAKVTENLRRLKVQRDAIASGNFQLGSDLVDSRAAAQLAELDAKIKSHQTLIQQYQTNGHRIVEVNEEIRRTEAELAKTSEWTEKNLAHRWFPGMRADSEEAQSLVEKLRALNRELAELKRNTPTPGERLISERYHDSYGWEWQQQHKEEPPSVTDPSKLESILKQLEARITSLKEKAATLGLNEGQQVRWSTLYGSLADLLKQAGSRAGDLRRRLLEAADAYSVFLDHAAAQKNIITANERLDDALKKEETALTKVSDATNVQALEWELAHGSLGEYLNTLRQAGPEITGYVVDWVKVAATYEARLRAIAAQKDVRKTLDDAAKGAESLNGAYTRLGESAAELAFETERERTEWSLNNGELRKYTDKLEAANEAAGYQVYNIGAVREALLRQADAYDVMKRNSDAVREAKQAYEEARSPAQKYADQLRLLNDPAVQSRLSIDQLTAAVAKARRDFEQAGGYLSAFSQSLQKNMVSSFSDAMMDENWTGTMEDRFTRSLDKMGTAWKRTIERMLIEAISANLMQSLLGFGPNGGWGTNAMNWVGDLIGVGGTKSGKVNAKGGVAGSAGPGLVGSGQEGVKSLTSGPVTATELTAGPLTAASADLGPLTAASANLGPVTGGEATFGNTIVGDLSSPQAMFGVIDAPVLNAGVITGTLAAGGGGGVSDLTGLIPAGYGVLSGPVPAGGGWTPPDFGASATTDFVSAPLLEQRAAGGLTFANNPYIIGEKGPEVFVPTSTGNVHSTEELMAAMSAKSQDKTKAPVLQIHPDAMNMTLRDWFEGEMARQAAERGS